MTRIRGLSPPGEFQDVQERGPYKTWIHTHRFVEDPGGVTIHDRVEYELPLGPLGRLAHLLAVKRQLEAIFDYRREAVAEIFGAGAREDLRHSGAAE